MRCSTYGMTRVMWGESLPDVVQWIKRTPRLWHYEQSRDNHATVSWDLEADMAGALRMAETGWEEGIKDLSDRLSAIPPSVDSHAVLRYDVGGAMPDVPRFLAGDPAHMVTRGRAFKGAPVVHIVINVVAMATVKAQHYANYGAALCALIDKLEATGRRVELDVSFVDTLKDGSTLLAGWKAKRADEPLDLGAIAFAVGHPACFRRIGFAMVERTPRTCESIGYGHCASLTKRHAGMVDAEDAWLMDGINTAYASCNTVNDALAFMVQRANQFAGEELVTMEN